MQNELRLLRLIYMLPIRVSPTWLTVAVLWLGVSVRAYASIACQLVSRGTLPTRVVRQVFTPKAVADTTVGKVIMVYIRQPGLSDNRAAEFSTDGQRIAGLTAAELNKKFSKNGYAVRVLNFLIASGYRVIGFAPARYGYNYLLERVR